MNTKLERLKAMMAELGEMYPGMTIQISSATYGQCIDMHQVRTYQQGTELMRELGVQRRDKTVYGDQPGGRCVLQGDAGGIPVKCFVDELPPTCRIETVTEKIPKQQTVDTGEFIEVQRLKVVCTEPIHV